MLGDIQASNATEYNKNVMQPDTAALALAVEAFPFIVMIAAATRKFESIHAKRTLERESSK